MIILNKYIFRMKNCVMLHWNSASRHRDQRRRQPRAQISALTLPLILTACNEPISATGCIMNSILLYLYFILLVFVLINSCFVHNSVITTVFITSHRIAQICESKNIFTVFAKRIMLQSLSQICETVSLYFLCKQCNTSVKFIKNISLVSIVCDYSSFFLLLVLRTTVYYSAKKQNRRLEKCCLA